MDRRQFLASSLVLPATALHAQPARPGAEPRFIAAADQCTLTNSLITRKVDVAAPGLRLASLQNGRTGFDWAMKGRAADLLLMEGKNRAIGLGGDSGFRFLRQSSRELPKGALECRIDYVRERPDTTCSFFWTGFPGTSVIEQRCVIQNTGKTELAAVSRFDPVCLWLRDDSAPMLAHWVQGMRGAQSGPPDPEPYNTFRYRREPLGDTLRLVGGRRSAELDTAWLALENTRAREILFMGIEWAGEWGIRLLRRDGGILLTAGVINSVHDIKPGDSLASPRIFMGLIQGDLNDATREMHRYQIDFVLPPKLQNFPWATYEPWLPMAANMEEAYWPEVQAAAEVGVECFYIGPHWYEGSNQNLEVQNHNYTPGLGTWRENRSRFPKGLAAFSSRVHGLGLKFGLWVEPERIDDRLVPSKFPASFQASRGGVVHKRIVRDANGIWDPRGAAVCLGNPEVVAWMKDSLSRMVEDYGVDWIKWDNNFYEICDDPGHGHQAGNGNYAHMLGVYAVWEHLATKFSHLVIENCAGGGNRLDFGLARYCRTNWLADSTAPSYRVRYHVEGASFLLPAPYLYSWIWTPRTDQAGAGDSLAMNTFMSGIQEVVNGPHSQGFLDNLFRSRMLGACGIGLNGLASARASLWSAEVREAARRNIANYKKYRHLFWEDMYRLTPQPHLFWPALDPPTGWEVMGYSKRNGAEAAYLCFRGDTEEARFRVRPRGLSAERKYRITSLNTGASSTVAGAVILRDGIQVEAPEKLGSEILMVQSV